MPRATRAKPKRTTFGGTGQPLSEEVSGPRGPGPFSTDLLDLQRWVGELHLAPVKPRVHLSERSPSWIRLSYTALYASLVLVMSYCPDGQEPRPCLGRLKECASVHLSQNKPLLKFPAHTSALCLHAVVESADKAQNCVGVPGRTRFHKSRRPQKPGTKLHGVPVSDKKRFESAPNALLVSCDFKTNFWWPRCLWRLECRSQ